MDQIKNFTIDNDLIQMNMNINPLMNLMNTMLSNYIREDINEFNPNIYMINQNMINQNIMYQNMMNQNMIY